MYAGPYAAHDIGVFESKGGSIEPPAWVRAWYVYVIVRPLINNLKDIPTLNFVNKLLWLL